MTPLFLILLADPLAGRHHLPLPGTPRRGVTRARVLSVATANDRPLVDLHTRRFPPTGQPLAERERHMAPRPCLDCGRLTPTGPRCADCERPRARATQRSKRQRRPYTTPEKRRRAVAVDQWVSTHGQWCPGWQREPHPSSDLVADHVVPYAAGGAEDGPLRVLCRSCNSSRGARP
jgi:5-methylcytosine-specific restriction protein A